MKQVIDDQVFYRDFFKGINFDQMDVSVPPPSFISSGAEVIEYEPRKSLTTRFLVKEHQVNPVKKLQGGILSSFFDDTIGPLSYSAARTVTFSINLNVSFIRFASLDEYVTIKADVVSRGVSLLHIQAKAFNEKDKVIATATSDMQILRVPSK